MKRMLFGKLFIIGAGLILAFSMGPIAASAAQAAKPAATHAVKKTHKPRKVMHNKRIMAVQEALNKKGFHLKVDGIMGKHTRAAIRKFQKENMLKVNGKLDKETRVKLGIARNKMKP